MSIFAELRRRNVFRVGVAYAVGAWLLLQLTEVLSELLTLPEKVGPVVVALVVIGLPITLILAWLYEMTPQGIMREKDVDRSQSITRQTGRKLDRTIIGVLAVIVGGALTRPTKISPASTDRNSPCRIARAPMFQRPARPLSLPPYSISTGSPVALNPILREKNGRAFNEVTNMYY